MPIWVRYGPVWNPTVSMVRKITESRAVRQRSMIMRVRVSGRVSVARWVNRTSGSPWSGSVSTSLVTGSCNSGGMPANGAPP